MEGFEDVFAGGNVRDGEVAVRIGDGEEGMIHNKNIGEHPGVDVAFHADGEFGDVEAEAERGAAGHLGAVELAVAAGEGDGVDVVQHGVGVFEGDFLMGHGAGNVGLVETAGLIDEDGVAGSNEFFAVEAAADEDEDVGKAAVGGDEIVAGGDGMLMELAAIGVGGEVADEHLRGRGAFQDDGAGDGAAGFRNGAAGERGEAAGDDGDGRGGEFGGNGLVVDGGDVRGLFGGGRGGGFGALINGWDFGSVGGWCGASVGGRGLPGDGGSGSRHVRKLFLEQQGDETDGDDDEGDGDDPQRAAGGVAGFGWVGHELL